DEPTFPIDNNVRRVLGRYFGATSEPHISALASESRDAARESGGTHFVRDVHFGVIVHGWEVCRARPKCGACELKGRCAWAAAARSVQEEPGGDRGTSRL